MSNTTNMRAEINEIPDVVQRLLDSSETHIDALASQLEKNSIPFLVSVARGSSDHACTYIKYASELMLNRPMASIGPSVASIYKTEIKTPGAVCLAVSQSGESPDIVNMVSTLRRNGAVTIAITNTPDSQITTAAEHSLYIQAGTEKSVAATKTFVASLVAGLWLIAKLSHNNELMSAIKQLPPLLARAIECDWSGAAQAMQNNSLYTVGRGPCWAIANEAALKFKETCQIHAESYSSAELLHGPVSLVSKGFPVLGFIADDAAKQASVNVCDYLAEKGARTFITSNQSQYATSLPHVRTPHWLTDPITLIVTFYCLIEQVAKQMGIDPDNPRHLQKVTQTQ